MTPALLSPWRPQGTLETLGKNRRVEAQLPSLGGDTELGVGGGVRVGNELSSQKAAQSLRISYEFALSFPP